MPRFFSFLRYIVTMRNSPIAFHRTARFYFGIACCIGYVRAERVARRRGGGIALIDVISPVEAFLGLPLITRNALYNLVHRVVHELFAKLGKHILLAALERGFDGGVGWA